MARAGHHRPLGLLLVGCVAASALACSHGAPTSPDPVELNTDSGRTAEVVVVGDIGFCGAGVTLATSQLVENLPGHLLLAGDIAYPHGSRGDIAQCFDPDWGRFRHRWFAVPGNHDYETAGAEAFFDYFGDAAGTDGTGYYALRLGEWQVLMLNSNLPAGRGSAQWEFVRREIDLDRRRCSMAVWHHPVFSSGPHGPSAAMRDVFDLLEEEGVELVVSGHEHFYERFAAQSVDGRPSPLGLRQFIAGTGGAPLYPFVAIAPNSELRVGHHGALHLSLEPGGYRWEFAAVAVGLADAGFEPCH